MPKALLTENEIERLKEFSSYELLDTTPEETFDDLTFLASQICGTPIALVSLVSDNPQWFKSRYGKKHRVKFHFALMPFSKTKFLLFRMHHKMKDLRTIRLLVQIRTSDSMPGLRCPGGVIKPKTLEMLTICASFCFYISYLKNLS
jgi:hypothetical protein